MEATKSAVSNFIDLFSNDKIVFDPDILYKVNPLKELSALPKWLSGI